MSTLLIKNISQLVTCDDSDRVLTNVDVLCKDGFIEKISANLDATADRVIDGSHMLCYPGLVNTHHHLYQVFSRNLPQVQNMELFDWLKTLYEIWKNLDSDVIRLSSLTGMGELMKHGCTTCFDHHYVFPAHAGDLLGAQFAAADELGIRMYCSRGSMDLSVKDGGLPPDSVVQSVDEIMKDSVRVIEKYHDTSYGAMHRVALAPCSPFSVSADLLRESAILARQYGVRLHTHLCETKDEENFMLQREGVRPLEYMARLGGIGDDVWYAHGIHFNDEELHLLASQRSVGQKIAWQGRELTVELACDEAFRGMDIVLGAAENDIAKRFAPAIVKAGAVFVDNSSAFRMDPDVPLVIPEINPQDAGKHKGIIANPNCTTIVSLVAINALNQDSPIESIVASSYQATSGAGAGGPIELMNEVEALREGKTYEPKVFQYQIAYNVIPQIGGEAFAGYTSEEMKMQNEGRKIMHLPELKVSCTCVRVPVVRSHSVSIVVRTKEKISVERARELIAAAPGCKLVDDLQNKQYPMPLDTSDQDIVFVGRIRDDLTSDNGLNIWCCGDQVRKGAATNAVQIAQLLIEE